MLTGFELCFGDHQKNYYADTFSLLLACAITLSSHSVCATFHGQLNHWKRKMLACHFIYGRKAVYTSDEDIN